MVTVTSRLALTPLVLDLLPEPSPTAMTIATVGEADTRAAPAEAVDRLAQLATTDELIVVYGLDEPGPGPDANPIVTGLRDVLPRHTLVAFYIPPRSGPLRRYAAVLDGLLDVGSLPVVVTSAEAVPQVAAELHRALGADRVVVVRPEPAARDLAA